MSAGATLSDDGLTMTVAVQTAAGVLTATYERDPAAGPFTPEDVALAAQTLEAKAARLAVLPGQSSRTIRLSERVMLHIATGPPTWWLPRVQIHSNEVMVGWLRGLVALWWTGKTR